MEFFSSFRPRLEILEDRTVLTSYKWYPQVQGSLWSNPDNWAHQDPDTAAWTANVIGQPRAYNDFPSSASTHDKVYFLDPYGTCICNVAVWLDRLQVNSIYGSKIMLKEDLVIQDTLQLDSSFAEICGYRDATSVIHAKVYLRPAANMNWDRGILGNLDVIATRLHDNQDFTTIFVSKINGGEHEMHGTRFLIDGELRWQSGNVLVTNSAQEDSSIVIGSPDARKDAKFFISADGAY